ncbi:MAG TPA: hypothetical protein VMH49_04010 [Thermoplasmata archaeon]|nr:hypothetical protein [Thermoplasmata archaeon]
MPTGVPIDLRSALLLRELRSFLRRSRARPVAIFFAVAYTLGSLLVGGMLSLYPAGGQTTFLVVLGSGTGQSWWLYPGLIVLAPWGVLALPFFTTIAMVAVAVGVGLGMAVAAALIVRLLRPSPTEVARSKAIGAATGLTPAMIGLVTLGSCCTTTAAATGGVGLIAQASGTTTANLITNNWYLGVAQVVIVWAALLGQELLLVVYGGLLGLRGEPGSVPTVAPPPSGARWALGAVFRGALAIGGLLWSLSMFASWTTHDPLTAGAGLWFQWLVQHQLVAAVAVGAAFFPQATLRALRTLRVGWGRLGGVALGAAALSVLVWLPAGLVAAGLDSLTDQALGLLGIAGAWGATAPGAVTGVPLYVRWALEYVLTAGFVLGALVVPEATFRPLLATVAREAGPGPSVQPALHPALGGVHPGGPEASLGTAPAGAGGQAGG